MDPDYSLFLNTLNHDHPEWSIEALAFICRGVDFFNSAAPQQTTDSSAQDLIHSLCLHALNEYGPLALHTLNGLNFHKISDLIQVINLLIERKIITGIERFELENRTLNQSLCTKFPEKSLPEPHLWPKTKKVDNFQFFR
ncbi:hypothetical protein LNTAR_16057 [Lentisphaera araneosa HTCC2155]|uniref:Uncharacterized protein n=1 Tax=Lentisphaera araneosa HTCC2155 TaxID=313628 RepID=A6DMK9_9BACT|nr:Minf_1886 family protein [Lentisphaera araneosa]EDM27199.1 hypothetical protein LNTAR_16057 [Lentisphaera araneosa HTCC2155]